MKDIIQFAAFHSLMGHRSRFPNHPIPLSQLF